MIEGLRRHLPNLSVGYTTSPHLILALKTPQKKECLFVLLSLLSLVGCRSDTPSTLSETGRVTTPSGSPEVPRNLASPSTINPQIGLCPALHTARSLGSLPAGESQIHTLSGGGAHLFELEIEASEPFQVEVDQQGIDVYVALLGHHGIELLSSDNLTGNRGIERLSWWSEKSLHYRLLICAPHDEGARGTYLLSRAPVRRATARDHARIAAALAYREGHHLLRGAKATSARQAATSFQEALALWQESGDAQGMVHSLYYLGKIAREGPAGHHQALDYFESALERIDESQSPQLAAAILYEIGSLHQESGELSQAANLFTRALPLLQKSGVLPFEATVANELGFLHVRSGLAAQALPHYRHALEIWRRISNEVKEAQVLHNLGRSYFHLGDQEQARHHLEQALAIRQSLGRTDEQASTLTALGGVFSRLNKHRQAIESLSQALELRPDGPKSHGRVSTLVTLGVAYRRDGRIREALASYEKALTILRQTEDLRQEALVLNDLGWLHHSLGQADQAVDYFRQALPLFETTADPRWVTMTHCGLAFAERHRGNLLVAKTHIEKALERAEILRLLPASTKLQHTVFASMQSFYSFYVDLLMDLDEQFPRAGYATQALSASEHARARALLDALVESDAGSPFLVSSELRRQELRLEREIQQRGSLRRRLIEDSPNGPQHMAAEEALRELFAEYDALHQLIRMENPRYASFVEPRVLPPEVIQRELLDSETLLLEYKLGAERSFLWAVTEDTVQSFQLPPQSTIEEIARRVYRLLSHGGRRQVKTEIELAKLSEIVLGPVADLLGARRLLIVNDRALEYIPFAALPRPGALVGNQTRQPLLLEHEIVTLPSASVATVLRRQRLGRQSAPGWVAILADPVFQPDDPRVVTLATESTTEITTEITTDPPVAPSPVEGRSGPPVHREFTRLIYSSQEAKAVLEQVPEDLRFLATGFAANRATALSPRLSQYRILHFATHGDLDTEHPELSRLVLSLVDEEGKPQRGFLYAHEIYDLNLPADLVVLSACQTALGKEIRGEGLVGLTQGFLYAGASRVLVSLWNIDDQATATLMAHLYRHLLSEGQSPAAALRNAQLEIRQQKGWSSPFFWAGFILQGEWQ
jgi:CHAT domain-containing protein/Tfp pilus assembly protein PilF